MMEGLNVGLEPKARKLGCEKIVQAKPVLSVQVPLWSETIRELVLRSHNFPWDPTDSVRTRADAVSC